MGNDPLTAFGWGGGNEATSYEALDRAPRFCSHVLIVIHWIIQHLNFLEIEVGMKQIQPGSIQGGYEKPYQDGLLIATSVFRAACDLGAMCSVQSPSPPLAQL